MTCPEKERESLACFKKTTSFPELVQGSLKFDASGEGMTSHIDDEYRLVGVKDLKCMITASFDLTSCPKTFAEQLKLVFPCEPRQAWDEGTSESLQSQWELSDSHWGLSVGLIVGHLPFGLLLHTVQRFHTAWYPRPGNCVRGKAPPCHPYGFSLLGKKVSDILCDLFLKMTATRMTAFHSSSRSTGGQTAAT